jgi:anti-sigma factor RsiW
MDCRDVRLRLVDHQRGRLPDALDADVRAHLAGCPACERAAAVEAALTEALEERLPQYPAPVALKRRLAAEWARSRVEMDTGGEARTAPSSAVSAGAPAAGTRGHRLRRALLPALAAAIVLLALLPLARLWPGRAGAPAAGARLVAEVVTDHLRVLASQHPLDVESGDAHQVRPWFAGRLDFAPAVAFDGDAEFPLRGGALGYVFDRKAAVLVYGHRLHTITLLVFPAEGLGWPQDSPRPVGANARVATTERGYSVLLWRQGPLAYALVSDVDAATLGRLADRIAGPAT